MAVKQMSRSTIRLSGRIPNMATAFPVEYLVIAGGAGGGNGFASGGGGAGGYRCSVPGESSGGLSSAEPILVLGGTYSIAVGAGGALAANGANSTFASIVSVGGGRGSGSITPGALVGGSGGGGSASSNPGAGGTANQGFNGGNGLTISAANPAGGGGGAGMAGVNATSNNAGNGGDGISSSITGTAVTRGGGGGGGMTDVPNRGFGGAGGGGIGGTITESSSPGEPNTGGGGGGQRNQNNVGTGGSGIVVFTVPQGTSVLFSGGVAFTRVTSGNKDRYIVTATDPGSTVRIG